MPQAIAVLAIAVLGTMVLMGALASLLIVGVCGLLATGLVYLFPMPTERQRVNFGRYHATISCSARRVCAPGAKFLRALPIVAAVSLPALNLMLAPWPKGEASILLFGSMIAAPIVALGVAVWGIDVVNRDPGTETLPGANLESLGQLLAQQQRLDAHRKPGDLVNDYVVAFDTHLAQQQWSRTQSHWQELEACAAQLAKAAEREFTLWLLFDEARLRLVSSRKAAANYAKRSDRIADHENWRQLRALIDEYRNMGFEPDSADSNFKIIMELIEMTKSFVGQNNEQPSQDAPKSKPSNSDSIPPDIVQAFATLGLTPSRNLEEVQAAYRYYRGIHHPDRGGAAANPERFHKVQQAWEILRAWLSG